MTNFEWLIKEKPKYIKELLQGKSVKRFVNLGETSICPTPECGFLFSIAEQSVCRTRFKFWLEKEHEN